MKINLIFIMIVTQVDMVFAAELKDALQTVTDLGSLGRCLSGLESSSKDDKNLDALKFFQKKKILTC